MKIALENCNKCRVMAMNRNIKMFNERRIREDQVLKYMKRIDGKRRVVVFNVKLLMEVAFTYLGQHVAANERMDVKMNCKVNEARKVWIGKVCMKCNHVKCQFKKRVSEYNKDNLSEKPVCSYIYGNNN